MILVDTNVWGRITRVLDPGRGVAIKAIRHFVRNGPILAVSAQSVYEFYVVATRPVERNGLGWPPSRALPWLGAMRRVCQFLPEDPRVTDVWQELIAAHGVQGKPAHDARLVATMRVYGIDTILTFNGSDFSRFPITVLDPQNLPAN